MRGLKELSAAMKQQRSAGVEAATLQDAVPADVQLDARAVVLVKELDVVASDPGAARPMHVRMKSVTAPFATAPPGTLAGKGGPTPADATLLHDALAAAAALEFATIPLYLAALWSVIDQTAPIARSIRAVLHEEMLHLALVNNILAAVGGHPRLTADAAPVFPGRLPAGVHPELWVALDGLTDRSLDIFLEIERPQVRMPIEGLDLDEDSTGEDRTIGEFYKELLAFLREVQPRFATGRQVAGPLAPMVVTSLDDVARAFAIITSQGEGSTGTPVDETGALAHYYRFLEIKLERALVWTDGRLLLGDRRRRPPTYPVAPPPPTGYGGAHSPRIQQLSADFNTCYSDVLRCLERAWAGEGHVQFLRAMELMFNLRPIAQEMLRTPSADGCGYCPEFRYVAETQSP